MNELDSRDRQSPPEPDDTGLRDMKLGALFAGGSLVITIVGYYLAGANGSVRVGWITLMLGVIRFMRGLNRYESKEMRRSRSVTELTPSPPSVPREMPRLKYTGEQPFGGGAFSLAVLITIVAAVLWPLFSGGW